MTERNEPENLLRGPVEDFGLSRPVVTPLQPSVVYATESPKDLDAIHEGRALGYSYAREGHPNAKRLGQMIDKLEGATNGVVTGSGMAAVVAALLAVVKEGDHVLAANQLYGRSLRYLREEMPRMGVETGFADACDVAAFRKAVRPNTRVILVEVISNPTIRVSDMTAITELAGELGALLIVDNTFTTPKGFKPFDHGADIVLHSVTKLLAGHSDATLGYVAAKDAALQERLSDVVATMGLTPSPFDCWLAERGLYTFDMRFERVQGNAEELARALAEHPKVETVIYPGLPDHPDYDRAQRLVDGNFGNMVSFVLKGDRARAETFVGALPEVAFAPTLGDIGTTLSHPASSSHRSMSHQERADIGITDAFFRVSVGIEEKESLVAAFLRAIDAI